VVPLLEQNLSTDSPAIATDHLVRRFGDFTAVADVSLEVRRGEIFGLIGSNGAGKSTLVKMLTTLLPPSAGAATVAGYDVVHQAAEVRRHIGYVPQLLSADGSLTGYENMLLSARLYAVPEHRRRIAEALQSLGLADAANRLVQHYSGGMIRRLEIAQSMLHRPSILFMDEPTVGLDPLARDQVWEHVRQLRRDFAMTILLTTHYLDEADVLCDRIAVMRQGRIVACDTAAALKAKAGPGATLDNAFALLTGDTAVGDDQGDFSATRRERRSEVRHG
jgi:ABC-2 type transport system ATP-binding protein